jgi:hypothetical protein
VEYALRRPDLGAAFRAYLEGLDIEAIAPPRATGPSRRRSR